MSRKAHKRLSLDWFAVVVLFETKITGSPDKDRLDNHYDDKHKIIEEQIIVVRAQSPDDAFELAEKSAKDNTEMTYRNPYGQHVQCRFLESVNCQKLFAPEIRSGSEVYFRLYLVPNEMSKCEFINTYIPETQRDIDQFYNFLIS